MTAKLTMKDLTQCHAIIAEHGVSVATHLIAQRWDLASASNKTLNALTAIVTGIHAGDSLIAGDGARRDSEISLDYLDVQAIGARVDDSTDRGIVGVIQSAVESATVASVPRALVLSAIMRGIGDTARGGISAVYIARALCSDVWQAVDGKVSCAVHDTLSARGCSACVADIQAEVDAIGDSLFAALEAHEYWCDRDATTTDCTTPHLYRRACTCTDGVRVADMGGAGMSTGIGYAPKRVRVAKRVPSVLEEWSTDGEKSVAFTAKFPIDVHTIDECRHYHHYTVRPWSAMYAARAITIGDIAQIARHYSTVMYPSEAAAINAAMGISGDIDARALLLAIDARDDSARRAAKRLARLAPKIEADRRALELNRVSLAASKGAAKRIKTNRARLFARG